MRNIGRRKSHHAGKKEFLESDASIWSHKRYFQTNIEHT